MGFTYLTFNSYCQVQEYTLEQCKGKPKYEKNVQAKNGTWYHVIVCRKHNKEGNKR